MLGALYWQLNDIWQAPSWASTEFGGKWKVLHNYARHFFSSFLVSPWISQDGKQIHVSVINDALQSQSGYIQYQLLSWENGQAKKTWQTPFSVSQLASKQVDTLTIASMLSQGSCQANECVLLVEAFNNSNSKLSENIQYLSPLSQVSLKAPKITYTISKTEKIFEIELTSDAMAPFVYLDFLPKNVAGRFSDNGFLLLPSQPKKISFYPWAPVLSAQISANLKIKTISDTY